MHVVELHLVEIAEMDAARKEKLELFQEEAAQLWTISDEEVQNE